jgi:hypothetical protein
MVKQCVAANAAAKKGLYRGTLHRAKVGQIRGIDLEWPISNFKFQTSSRKIADRRSQNLRFEI